MAVVRIPHGYAYPYLGLDDPEREEGQAPHEIGRAQFGRISIANSDSEARGYMDAAFDAAWRAVEEQTGWGGHTGGNHGGRLGLGSIDADRRAC